MTTKTPSATLSMRVLAGALIGALVLAPALWQRQAQSAEAAVSIPAPAVDEVKSDARSATAVFAGGCFWGVQGVFQHVQGVTKALSGYAGGDLTTAQYEDVGSGSTGHAESVQITYDPQQISYGRLLQIYFSVAHDPTQLNRQGPDRGTQYRSSVFPLDDSQRKVATQYIAQLDASGVYPRPLATTIETGKTFYPAENYHQDYLTLNPTNGYIVANDLPKVANLKRMFPETYRDTPVLVQARR